MQLKTVVLPAPLGPISAVISLRAAVKERSPMATRPPKRMVRWSTRSSGSPSCAGISAVTLSDEFSGNRLLLLEKDRRLARRHEAAWPPAHDQHHCDADGEHAVLGGIETLRDDGGQKV